MISKWSSRKGRWDTSSPRRCYFSWPTIFQDKISEKLFKKTGPDIEAMCMQALEMTWCAMLLILECQCADQLSGGKYWKTDKPEIFTNVPPTNVIREKTFLLWLEPSALSLTIKTIHQQQNTRMAYQPWPTTRSLVQVEQHAKNGTFWTWNSQVRLASRHSTSWHLKLHMCIITGLRHKPYLEKNGAKRCRRWWRK